MSRAGLMLCTLLFVPLSVGCGDKTDPEDTAEVPDTEDTGGDTAPPDDTDTTVDTVGIPKADLSTTATFFEYEGETATIRYFAVIDEAGAYHVAFDACDACYPADKGYSQDGVEVVCNNCGNRYAIDELGTQSGGGGCWPGHLPFTETDTELVIQVSDLEAGSYYFE